MRSAPPNICVRSVQMLRSSLKRFVYGVDSYRATSGSFPIDTYTLDLGAFSAPRSFLFGQDSQSEAIAFGAKIKKARGGQRGGGTLPGNPTGKTNNSHYCIARQVKIPIFETFKIDVALFFVPELR
jgi:hypothetical protein